MTLTLSVTKQPVRVEHTFEQHVNCQRERCHVCAGLLICTVCGAAEGELLDSCPGVRLTMEQHEWNYEQMGQRIRTSMRGGTTR